MRGRGGASTNCCADADADCGGPYTIPVTVAIPVTAAAIPVTAAAIRVTAAVPATRITAAAAVPATTITGAAAAVPATGAAATVNHICEGIVKSPNARGAEHLYRLTLRRSVKECAGRHQHCRH
jgi:hypothetical protein